MGTHHCDHCWDHTCTCGWEYRHLSIDDLTNLIYTLERVYDFQIKNKDAKFGLGTETEDDKRFLKWMRNESI